MINILVRTSNRPNEFIKCINSILEQTYTQFKIICCYDDIRSKEYISKINNKRLISYYIDLKDNCFHYKYNLYCNLLLDKVVRGWIMFLDDDDMLSDKNALKTIMNYTNNINNFIFWKVLIKDKLIYPKNLNNITMGEIANSGFCFHSSFKNYSRWCCERGSDYLFIKTLERRINSNKIFINKCFVKTQLGPNRGKKIESNKIENYDIEHMFLSKQRYKSFFSFKQYNDNSTKPCLFVGINNREIIHKINNYKGYTYVFFQTNNELMNLMFIKKTKKIKILLSHYIDQKRYIQIINRNICSLHYDVIYSDCR